MRFNTGWKALIEPGLATDQFTWAARPALSADQTVFSHAAAWWFAELSRWTYSKAQGRGPGPWRAETLARVQGSELVVAERRGIHGAVVRLIADGGSPVTVLVFRGTDQPSDWLVDLDSRSTRWATGGRVHHGFMAALDRVWSPLSACLDTIDLGPTIYTGHSLGAALATLAASRRPPTATYAYGGPRVGDLAFTHTLDEQRMFRIVNHRDVVCTVPPAWLGFCHAGELHYLTHQGTRLVNPTRREINEDRHRGESRRWPDGQRSGPLDPPRPFADHTPVNYVAQFAGVATKGSGSD